MAHGTVVIGIGNTHRSDDAVGRHVIRLLRKGPPTGTVLMEIEGDVADLVAAWRGAKVAILIDACAHIGQTGRIHRQDGLSGKAIIMSPAISTHGLGLAEAIGLSRAVKGAPDRIIVYAVEGETFELGDIMSADVAAAVPVVAAAVRRDLSDPDR